MGLQKLTDEDCAMIRHRYFDLKESTPQIAKDYPVGKDYIAKICRNMYRGEEEVETIYLRDGTEKYDDETCIRAIEMYDDDIAPAEISKVTGISVDHIRNLASGKSRRGKRLRARIAQRNWEPPPLYKPPPVEIW